MQIANLQITLYAYRFITETLYPHERFKPIDVQPGGTLYCLTQIFLNKILPREKPNVPVDLLFTARSNEPNFKKYKPEVTSINFERSTNKVALTFKSLTHEKDNIPTLAATFVKKLYSLQEKIAHIEHAEIEPKFAKAFEAVETCLKTHPDKLFMFETILTDWTNATPGYRAKAINFDPFIHELYEAIKDISPR